MNRAKTITHPQTDSARWENEVFQPMRPNQLDPSLTNLARSILSQAFRDLLANQNFKQESEFWRSEFWREDASDWFFSEETYPGSLNWVCEVLQLEPWVLWQWLTTYYQSSEMKQQKMVKILFRGLERSRSKSVLPS